MAKKPSRDDSYCELMDANCRWAYMGVCLAHPDEGGRKKGLAVYTKQTHVDTGFCSKWFLERKGVVLDPYIRIESVSPATRKTRASAGNDEKAERLFYDEGDQDN